MTKDEAAVWEELIKTLEASLAGTPTERNLETVTAVLETAKSAFGVKHPNTATSHERQGDVLYKMGRLKDAEAAYKEALEILNDTEEIPTLSRLARTLGGICESQGREREAMAYYDQALPLLEKIHGQKYPGLLILLNNTALMHKGADELDEAERLFKHAMEIADKLHPFDHSDKSLILNNLGNLYVARGNYDQGEVMLRRALSIREGLYGRNHPDVAQTVSNIAVIHHYQGHLDLARQNYERALNVLLKQSALEPDEINIVTDNLCTLLLQIGSNKEADRVRAHVADYLSPNAPEGAAPEPIPEPPREKLSKGTTQRIPTQNAA